MEENEGKNKSTALHISGIIYAYVILLYLFAFAVALCVLGSKLDDISGSPPDYIKEIE